MKYIFLDEYVWIDICRYSYGERNAPDLSAVVPLFNKKAKDGEWAFPLTYGHVEETSGTLTYERRKKLVITMALLSKGYTIPLFRRFREREIAELLAGNNLWEEPSNVIVQDPSNLFGKNSREQFELTLKENGISRESPKYDFMHRLFNKGVELGVPLIPVMMQPQQLEEEKKYILLH